MKLLLVLSTLLFSVSALALENQTIIVSTAKWNATDGSRGACYASGLNELGGNSMCAYDKATGDDLDFVGSTILPMSEKVADKLLTINDGAYYDCKAKIHIIPTGPIGVVIAVYKVGRCTKRP